MGLRQQLDAMEPHFKSGGRLEKWYALYEAVDTIFYSPNSVTRAMRMCAMGSISSGL
jgi:Na+-transporting NADH:ubiquinone oxidoreductase subunit B